MAMDLQQFNSTWRSANRDPQAILAVHCSIFIIDDYFEIYTTGSCDFRTIRNGVKERERANPNYFRYIAYVLSDAASADNFAMHRLRTLYRIHQCPSASHLSNVEETASLLEISFHEILAMYKSVSRHVQRMGEQVPEPMYGSLPQPAPSSSRPTDRFVGHHGAHGVGMDVGVGVAAPCASYGDFPPYRPIYYYSTGGAGPVDVVGGGSSLGMASSNKGSSDSSSTYTERRAGPATRRERDPRDRDGRDPRDYIHAARYSNLQPMLASDGISILERAARAGENRAKEARRDLNERELKREASEVAEREYIRSGKHDSQSSRERRRDGASASSGSDLSDNELRVHAIVSEDSTTSTAMATPSSVATGRKSGGSGMSGVSGLSGLGTLSPPKSASASSQADQQDLLGSGCGVHALAAVAVAHEVSRSDSTGTEMELEGRTPRGAASPPRAPQSTAYMPAGPAGTPLGQLPAAVPVTSPQDASMDTQMTDGGSQIGDTTKSSENEANTQTEASGQGSTAKLGSQASQYQPRTISIGAESVQLSACMAASGAGNLTYGNYALGYGGSDAYGADKPIMRRRRRRAIFLQNFGMVPLYKGITRTKVYGYRVQLNHEKGSNKKFSRNIDTFYTAMWLYEIAVLILDRPKEIDTLMLSGNFQSMLALKIVRGKEDYYRLLGEAITYLSRPVNNNKLKDAEKPQAIEAFDDMLITKENMCFAARFGAPSTAGPGSMVSLSQIRRTCTDVFNMHPNTQLVQFINDIGNAVLEVASDPEALVYIDGEEIL